MSETCLAFGISAKRYLRYLLLPRVSILLYNQNADSAQAIFWQHKGKVSWGGKYERRRHNDKADY